MGQEYKITATIVVEDPESGETETRERVTMLDRSSVNAAFGTFTRALDNAIPQKNWHKV